MEVFTVYMQIGNGERVFLRAFLHQEMAFAYRDRQPEEISRYIGIHAIDVDTSKTKKKVMGMQMQPLVKCVWCGGVYGQHLQGCKSMMEKE